MERALNVGMPHSTILQKFVQGTWLGQTAKLKLMNYMRNNVTAFKAKVTTPEKSVQNNTIALADYVMWFCKTFYVKQSYEKITRAIMDMSLQSFESTNAKGEYDLSNADALYHTLWDKRQEL